jgi:hypothetical protein
MMMMMMMMMIQLYWKGKNRRVELGGRRAKARE